MPNVALQPDHILDDLPQCEKPIIILINILVIVGASSVEDG